MTVRDLFEGRSTIKSLHSWRCQALSLSSAFFFLRLFSHLWKEMIFKIIVTKTKNSFFPLLAPFSLVIFVFFFFTELHPHDERKGNEID